MGCMIGIHDSSVCTTFSSYVFTKYKWFLGPITRGIKGLYPMVPVTPHPTLYIDRSREVGNMQQTSIIITSISFYCLKSGSRVESYSRLATCSAIHLYIMICSFELHYIMYKLWYIALNNSSNLVVTSSIKLQGNCASLSPEKFCGWSRHRTLSWIKIHFSVSHA